MAHSRNEWSIPEINGQFPRLIIFTQQTHDNILLPTVVPMTDPIVVPPMGPTTVPTMVPIVVPTVGATIVPPEAPTVVLAVVSSVGPEAVPTNVPPHMPRHSNLLKNKEIR